MKAIDIARKVTEEKTACLFRPKRVTGLAGIPELGIAPLCIKGEYDVKPLFTGNKRGWILLDLFSASALVAMHDALSLENREKLGRLCLSSQVKLAFRLVK